MDRVHLFGTSIGAGSSLIHAMRRPRKVRSVVAIFPMTDFARWLEEQPRYREPVEEAHGISPEPRQQALGRISPIHNIAAFRDTPLYLLHGTQDSVVDPDHSRRFGLGETHAPRYNAAAPSPRCPELVSGRLTRLATTPPPHPPDAPSSTRGASRASLQVNASVFLLLSDFQTAPRRHHHPLRYSLELQLPGIPE